MEKYLKLFIDYLTVLNLSAKTISGHRCHILHFFNYLKNDLNIRDVAKVTSDIIFGYQHKLFTVTTRFKRPLSPVAMKSYLCSVKVFFRFMTLHDHVLYNPSTLLELPKREKHLPRVILTKKEMNKLLMQPDIATIQGYRDRVILEIFYSAGIRSKELINLNIYDVDIQKETLFIRKGKGGKDRVVPLTDTAAEFTEGYLLNIRKKLSRGNPTDALILRKSGLRIDENSLLRIIRLYIFKANIKKHIGCHTLRHTCATHLLAGGANIRYIQELLGHESLESTQVYTKVQIEDLKRIHKKHHPRERF